MDAVTEPVRDAAGPRAGVGDGAADEGAAAAPALGLELDLDCFAGPFDLLLALVLRDELDLAEVPLAEICVAYLERLAAGGGVDLESATEFLVLVAALLELKSRLLLPADAGEVDELSPEQAAEELAARLHEYARARAAAAWLRQRREELGRRVFRDGPPPLAPRRPEPSDLVRDDPERLRAALAGLLEPPPPVDVTHLPRRALPLRPLLDRFRRLLRERGAFVFDDAVARLDRLEQAVAFWAVLELYRRGEVRIAQDEPFAPIRVAPAAAAGRRRTPAADDQAEAVA